MDKVITIHHFDDESEQVRWIPGALLDRYWMRHPDWLHRDPCFNDADAMVTQFQLYPDKLVWQIRHRLYRTADEFREQFPRESLVGDVAIIDMMDGSDTPPGTELFKIAIGRLGIENVFLLTAFPRRPELAFVDASRLFTKPPDASAVVNAIFETLRLENRL